jgi:thioesterase domain-containing protein
LLLCSPRSGSSLLQLCLNANPALYAGQELFLPPFETLGERAACLNGTGFEEGLVKTVMELRECNYEAAAHFLDHDLGDSCPVSHVYMVLQRLAHPRILVDKTPPNAERLAFLHRARELFSNARYIHLVRHPYACISSGLQLARDTLGEAADWGALERLWVSTNASIAEYFAQVRGEAPTLTLTYEDLVSDAPSATRSVCELLGVPWHLEMVNPYQTDATKTFEPASRVAATDPKLLRRRALEPRLADKWREVHLPQPLSIAAKALALTHRYELLPELPEGLEWLSREHASSGAPPIACVHDFTGGLWAHAALAPLLHAPCLGINCTARMLTGCRTYHALAQRYLQLLPMSLWPGDTPVRILGYSLGCRIAHRMASELQAAGRAVKLILLDGPIGAGATVGLAPSLRHLSEVPLSDMPDEIRRVLSAAGKDAAELAQQLMALSDDDPEAQGAHGSLGAQRLGADDTQVVYVAAAGGQNRHNGTVQHALRVRSRAKLHTVEGTHFTFLNESALEVAQIVNEFLLGAAALLG